MKKFKKNSFIIIFALTALFITNVSAQIDGNKQSMLTLKGYIIDSSTGQPISDAKIIIKLENGAEFMQLFSENDGSYECLINRNHDYIIQVSKNFYEDAESELSTFDLDNTEDLIVELSFELYTITEEVTMVPLMPNFPWPPPKSSTKMEIPRKAFSNCLTLNDVDKILTRALSNQGYDDKNYFLVPSSGTRGFAIATPLEQINKNATSKNPPNRWKDGIVSNYFSFSEIIASIFEAQPGYFRVIVFIVTDVGFSQSNKDLDWPTLKELITISHNVLPKSMAKLSFTNEYNVTALIYEYKLPENSSEAKLQKPSAHSAKTHLVKSKLWSELIK